MDRSEPIPREVLQEFEDCLWEHGIVPVMGDDGRLYLPRWQIIEAMRRVGLDAVADEMEREDGR